MFTTEWVSVQLFLDLNTPPPRIAVSMSPIKDIYDPENLYAAARLYYEEDQGQSEIATHLGVSRPTVSRMLSQAREVGIVKIEVIHPSSGPANQLSTRLAEALGVQRCYIAPGLQTANSQSKLGAGLEPMVSQAISDMNLSVGDGLVISSGVAMYNVSRMKLPQLPGVVVSPAVGGLAEPEAWYQTSEIARAFAQNTGSTYIPLFAGVMPSTSLYEALQNDVSYQQVQHLWSTATGVLVGIGSRTSGRTSLASAIPKQALHEAECDICLHFFDADGESLAFPGSDRTIRIPLGDLRRIPHVVAVAVGNEKVHPIITAAKIGILNALVTDEHTAHAVLERIGS